MIVQDQGAEAGARWQDHVTSEKGEGTAFWVCGSQAQHEVLHSSSFNTCVGLVLYGDVDGHGAVVHFWAPAGLADAKTIVDRYMQYLLRQTGAYCGDDVEAVVFGGESIRTSAGEEHTKPRIDAIANWLEQRWDMRVLRVTQGSRTVKLHLGGTGPIEEHVEFDFGRLSTNGQYITQSPLSKANSGATTSGRGRSGSLTLSSKPKSKTDLL
jgi:hypothetical protein